MGPGVGRVDLIVGRFIHAILADKRLGQAVWVVDVVVAKAPFDAEALVIGRAIAALGTIYLVPVLVVDLVWVRVPGSAKRTLPRVQIRQSGFHLGSRQIPIDQMHITLTFQPAIK